jgi:hypothetical protein
MPNRDPDSLYAFLERQAPSARRAVRMVWIPDCQLQSSGIASIDISSLDSRRYGSPEKMLRCRTLLPVVAMLAACHGQPNETPESRTDGKVATSAPAAQQIVPVEFGRRSPNSRMTSDNMPFFDTVTYCLLTTRKTDTMFKGPAYEACIENQDDTRIVVGDAIDANRFAETDIIRCAKESRTAYVGMWYCMNGRPNSE